MLLAMDIGNTNILFGLHRPEGGWLGRWRIRTEPEITADEFAAKLQGLIQLNGFDLKQIDQVGLASGVPPLTAMAADFARTYLGVVPVIVNYLTGGIKVGYHNPAQLGADRIANAVAAYDLVKGAAVVVDFGTATNFEYVDRTGCFQGGVIAPGLHLTSQALFRKTAQLPQIDVLKKTDKIIAQDTVTAMTVGLFQGYVGLIEGLLKGILAEVDDRPTIIGTGGLVGVLADHIAFDRIEPDLTLEGIRLVWRRNNKA